MGPAGSLVHSVTRVSTYQFREVLPYLAVDFREVLLAVSTNNNHKDSGSEEEGEGRHGVTPGVAG